MKKVLFLKKNMEEVQYGHEEDVKKLVDIADQHGYVLSGRDAEEIWKDYSSRYNREWVDLYPSDKVLLGIILEHTVHYDEPKEN